MRIQLALLLSLVACQGPATGDEPRRSQPNVILVMTDDQGWGDLGVHGNTTLRTPNLDRMARASARIDPFYVAPVCAPTRAALMTGRHTQRTRAIDTYVGRAMLEPEEVTLAERLRDAGYATGIFGKWHLGDCAPMRPMDQGFERSLVHRGGGIGQPSDPEGGERRYTDPRLLDEGVERDFEGYCTDIYFDAAIDWIDQVRDDRPFFAYVATNAPHGPFHDVPEDLLAYYQGLDLPDRVARVYAMIENIDQNVGELFSALDARGLTDDTLVVFLCDNGPNTARFNGGLRETKSSVYDGGVRSPFFAHWPARLAPRHIEGSPAAHIDLVPTVLAACDVPRPDGLDGVSLLGLLDGSVAALPERPIIIQAHRGDYPVRYHHFMVRRGDWKLVHPTGFGRKFDWADRARGKSPITVDYEPELYDLASDPSEQRDVAAANPEVVASLTAVYEEWFNETGASNPYNYGPTPILLSREGPSRVVLTRQDWVRSDGRSWGDNGYWTVRFADDSSWSVRVRFPRGFSPTKVELGINSGVWTWMTHDASVLEEGARDVRINGVTHWYTARPATVACRLFDASGERGPYQMIWTREPATRR